jgi:lipopolysaccharide/colanic/teichoic acid biosynthesis glycosyltransferase
VNRVEENEDGTLNFITFPMIKFRTMMKDAEAKTGATLAKKNDMRITRIGGFLRKTRLDECPQFFNVLKGDMSIVGPRPERPELLENLSAAVPFFEERVRFLKPGITGLAQINLNYSGQLYPNHPLYKMKELLTNPFELANADDSTADDMRTKMLFDHAYSASLEKFSTFLYTEFSIILKTPWVMLFGKGR